LLWRHGQTAWNAAGRFQGQLDIELSEIGRAQAAASAVKLAALRPDLLFASDLRRAVDTAAALAELTGLEINIDARLRERCYGDWQGHSLAEIEARWPAEYIRWRTGKPVAGAGVEDLDDLAKRVGAALQDAVERGSGGTVVVAIHGGSARRAVAQLLGWPEAVTRTIGVLANCHWTELTFDAVRGWQLGAHNVG
jgi:glucosyl-3-phosphoglycerate phosphatase